MICSVIKKDYPNLSKIWEKAAKDTSDFLKVENVEFYRKYKMPYYFDQISFFAYIDQKGKMKGFLGVSKEKIEMLFVDDKSRRKGIGKKLMDFAINNLKICKVDVNEQNKNAVLFFNSLGFKVIGSSETDKEGKIYPVLCLEKSVS
ncbi:MAG: GNAT family N-acetyltransferase [Spirochaetaceae bacterium]|nr:GNAT family N-acetyltransferase [Spirochaetaceae bacterium]